MARVVSCSPRNDDFMEVFDYTLETFKKHVTRNCDQETAAKILRSTKRDLKKIVPNK